MSTATFSASYATIKAPKSIVNQGLSRRGRLGRTCVVLSLTVVMVAGFAAQSGAGQGATDTTPTFEIVVIAPGETLWTVATAYSTGDVQGLINQIREINHLKGFDLQTGQKLRVPLSTG